MTDPICTRCYLPGQHAIDECVHNIFVTKADRDKRQTALTALRAIGDHLNDLRRAWPRYSAQDQQLIQACNAVHALAKLMIADEQDDITRQTRD